MYDIHHPFVECQNTARIVDSLRPKTQHTWAVNKDYVSLEEVAFEGLASLIPCDFDQAEDVRAQDWEYDDLGQIIERHGLRVVTTASS
jgi:hypothetical protein